MVRFIRLLKLARMLKMGKLVQRIEDMLDLSPLALKPGSRLDSRLERLELARARAFWEVHQLGHQAHGDVALPGLLLVSLWCMVSFDR